MRWGVLLLLLVGCAHTPVLLGSAWERICYDSPVRRITTEHRQWLRQEGVVEQRGWTITPAWLNETCTTVPGVHRR